MAYFLPSSIQKRLLRYALSRLELLDTDALDLKDLDIAWGKKSTVELRGVAIKVEKLSSLLHLPKQIQLVEGRISVIQVTVPADIYSTGITITIEGISVKARLTPDEDVPRTPSAGGSKARAQQTHAHIGSDDHIPSAQDLAKSFLNEEPIAEREELEAALGSQSRKLQGKDVPVEFEEDEVGTGTGLSLPSFLSNFLKRVADRLEVTVKNIDVQLGLEIELNEPKQSQLEQAKVPASFQLRVAEVRVGSLAPCGSADSSSSAEGDAAVPRGQNRAGRRRIRLKHISSIVVSDASVYERLSRVSSPPSSVEADSIPPRSERTQEPSPPTRIPAGHTSTLSNASSVLPTQILESSVHERSISGNNIPRQIDVAEHRPLGDSILTQESEQFADAGEEENEDLNQAQKLRPDESPAPGTFARDSMYYGDSFLDEALEEGLIDSRFEDQSESQMLLSRSLEGMPDSPGRPATLAARRPFNVEPSRTEALPILSATVPKITHASKTSPASERLINSQPQPNRTVTTQGSPPKSMTESSKAGRTERDYAIKLEQTRSTSSSGDEDLSESKLFTHEDAASMYYSLANDSILLNDDKGSPASQNSAASDGTTGHPKSMGDSSPSPVDPAVPVAQSERESLRGTRGAETSNISVAAVKDSSITSESEKRISTSSLNDSQTEDKAANFRSPTREAFFIGKTFLNVDAISVWLPFETPSGLSVEDESMVKGEKEIGSTMLFSDDAFGQNMPGAFSQYAGSSTSKRRMSSTKQENLSPTSKIGPRTMGSQPSEPASVSKHENGPEISFQRIQLNTDISTARLISYSAQQLLQALATRTSDDRISDEDDGAPAGFETVFKVTIAQFHARLVELLPSIPHTDTEEATVTWGEHDSLQDKRDDAVDHLLELKLTGTEITCTVEDGYRAIIDVDKFNLSFADEDIVSFDARARMRTSVRDLREPQVKDISLAFTKSPTVADLRVATLPVIVSLDVHKLDETLGMFGGFSSVMELGASMGSNSTILAAPKTQSPARGVHFERPPEQEHPSPTFKLSSRLGGGIFTLKGKSCAVALQTSAIKIVSRASHVGLQIDDVKFTGPHRGSPTDEAAILLQLVNNRIDFLQRPTEDDLDQLVRLVAPSSGGYEHNGDIILNALLAQRKKGSLLRFTSSSTRFELTKIEDLTLLRDLGEEMTKLSAVTKYLPEESRPGMLCLGLIKELNVRAELNGQIGDVSISCQSVQVANITLPSLFAMAVGKVSTTRNNRDYIVHEVPGMPALLPVPMVMARIIGDDIEPTLKIKLNNTCLEYSIPTVMAFMGLTSEATTEDLTTSLAASVATVTDRPFPPKLTRQSSGSSEKLAASKTWQLDVLLQDCAIGLNAIAQSAKGLLVLTNTRFTANFSGGTDIMAALEIRKASMLLTNNAEAITDKNEHAAASSHSASEAPGASHIRYLSEMGFASVSTISAAKSVVTVKAASESDKGPMSIDVDFRDDLFILETCADSTQTLISILNGLKPPTPQTKEAHYRTEVMPVQDMMSSFSGDAYAQPDNDDSDPIDFDFGDHVDDDVPSNLEYVGSFYNAESLPSSEETANSMLEGDLTNIATQPSVRQAGDKPLLESFQEQYEVAQDALEFQEDYLVSHAEASAAPQRWDSSKNRYETASIVNISEIPLKVKIRDVHIIWNVFDGYDWQSTRDTISEAVNEVQLKAEERRKDRRRSYRDEDEEEPVIGDYLFNSIWIEVPPNRDPRDLSRQINRNIDDLVSETGSYATSAVSQSPSRQGGPRVKGRRLKLERSKHHKVTFELKGLSADLVVLPPGSGETQSSIDVRIMDFEIFDHVPSSTWRKFATYMRDAGERELDKPMIHLEILNVRPVIELAASELVLRVTVLPLRLHVDQDTLDFIIRFFEFKEDSKDTDQGQPDQVFLQRVEVNKVRVKLDYKPKKVDYAGLRSGHTTELMNFFILDGADIILHHVIIYGVSGFDKLNKTLNDIWMPDVRRNQLPGVLAGLAPVRSVVNIGSGVRDLVVIPMREYRKDGRVVRSIRKGALAFARTTTSEIARLGAKIAIGTQTVLQGAEGFLSPPASSPGRAQRGDASSGWDDDDFPSSSGSSPVSGPTRVVSNYADQPIGVLAGLRGAARSLERDLLTARDAIVAIPGEVMESESAGQAARAVARRAPTVILRPAIGASRAVGMTLLGAGNALDKESRRRIEDKYKRI